MDQNEKEFDQILAGAPRAAVHEFEREDPNSLSAEDLMGVAGGLKYGVAVDYQKDNTSVFSSERLEREKEMATMLGELIPQETQDSQMRR